MLWLNKSIRRSCPAHAWVYVFQLSKNSAIFWPISMQFHFAWKFKRLLSIEWSPEKQGMMLIIIVQFRFFGQKVGAATTRSKPKPTVILRGLVCDLVKVEIELYVVSDRGECQLPDALTGSKILLLAKVISTRANFKRVLPEMDIFGI